MNSIRHRFATRKELADLASNASLLFQKPSWFRTIEEGLKYRCVGVISGAPDPIMIVPYFSCRKGPFRMLGSPLSGSMTPYQEPLFLSKAAKNDYFDILISQYYFLRKEGFSWIEWRFSKLNPSAEKFAEKLGVKILKKGTFIIEMNPDIDVMWKKLNSKTRNMIRKAKRAGVEIRRCKGTNEELGIFYEMLKGTFAKSGLLPPHPLAFYEACVRNLMAENRLLFLSANIEGKSIAMGFFPHDENGIHFTSGTSLSNVSKYAPNNLIHWEVISFAVKNGLSFYDMGGAGMPSIDRFKKSMGGVFEFQPRIVWKSLLTKMAARIYTHMHF